MVVCVKEENRTTSVVMEAGVSKQTCHSHSTVVTALAVKS